MVYFLKLVARPEHSRSNRQWNTGQGAVARAADGRRSYIGESNEQSEDQGVYDTDERRDAGVTSHRSQKSAEHRSTKAVRGHLGPLVAGRGRADHRDRIVA